MRVTGQFAVLRPAFPCPGSPPRGRFSIGGLLTTRQLEVQMSGDQKLFGTIPRTAHTRAGSTKGASSADNERRRVISLRKSHRFS